MLIKAVRQIEHEFEGRKFRLMAKRYDELVKSEGKGGEFRTKEMPLPLIKEFLRMGPPNIEEWCSKWEVKDD